MLIPACIPGLGTVTADQEPGNGLTWHSFSPRHRRGLTYSLPGALAQIDSALLVALAPQGHQCRPDDFFWGTIEPGVDRP
jgi:hypothetical protein